MFCSRVDRNKHGAVNTSERRCARCSSPQTPRSPLKTHTHTHTLLPSPPAPHVSTCLFLSPPVAPPPQSRAPLLQPTRRYAGRRRRFVSNSRCVIAVSHTHVTHTVHLYMCLHTLQCPHTHTHTQCLSNIRTRSVCVCGNE